MDAVSTDRGGRPGTTTGASGAGLASTAPLALFRSAVLRRSVPVLATLVLALAAASAVDGMPLTVENGWFLGLTGLALVLGSRVRWTEVAAEPDSWTAWAWTVTVALVLGGSALLSPMGAAVRPLFAGVVIVSGLVLTGVRHVFVTLLTLGLVAGSFLLDAAPVTESLGVLALVAVSSVVSSLAGRQLLESSDAIVDRVIELEGERESYRRLYGLASSLGAARTPDESLPVLLEPMCRFLESHFGAWLVADEGRGVLRVVDPVFTEGVEVPSELPEIPMRGNEFVARAFRADRALSIANVTLKREREGLLGVLGLGTAMAVPLITDGRRVGVLVVGEPASGAYSEADAAELEVMSRPASLVVSQLVLHHEAKEVADSLREIADIKTDFVAVASHELRTPITSIRGALDTLRRPEIIGEHPLAPELLDSAIRQTARLERLIADLLVASRVDRGTLRSTLLPVDVNAILDEVLPSIRSDLVVVDPGTDRQVAADPDQLGQVIRNLVENAIKYGDGSPIEVRTRDVAGGVEIAVIDHGPGIGPEHRERVFDRFTQLARPDRRPGEGSGLGLSIVRSLVNAMGGRVSADETPGGGATFTVALKAATSGALIPA